MEKLDNIIALVDKMLALDWTPEQRAELESHRDGLEKLNRVFDVLLSVDEMDQVTCPFCDAMFDTILSDVVECPCCGAKIHLSTADNTERGVV